MAVKALQAVVEAPSSPNVVSIFRRKLGLPPLPLKCSGNDGHRQESTGPVKCLFGAPNVQESQAMSQKIEERAQWSFSRKWNFNITGKDVGPTKLESSNPDAESESQNYDWSPIIMTEQQFAAANESPNVNNNKTPTPKTTPTKQQQRPRRTTRTIVTFDSPPINTNLRCLRIRNGSHSILRQRAITDYVQVSKGIFRNNKKNTKSASDLTQLQKEATSFAIVFQHSS